MNQNQTPPMTKEGDTFESAATEAELDELEGYFNEPEEPEPVYVPQNLWICFLKWFLFRLVFAPWREAKSLVGDIITDGEEHSEYAEETDADEMEDESGLFWVVVMLFCISAAYVGLFFVNVNNHYATMATQLMLPGHFWSQMSAPWILLLLPHLPFAFSMLALTGDHLFGSKPSKPRR